MQSTGQVSGYSIAALFAQHCVDFCHTVAVAEEYNTESFSKIS